MANWPWCPPWEDSLAEVRYRYSLTTLTVPRRCLGLARRRVGRGGRSVHVLLPSILRSCISLFSVSERNLSPLLPCRVLLDRAFTDHDNIYHRLDPDILEPPPPPSPSVTPPSLPPSPPPPPTTTLCSPVADKFASTSETNTSDRSSLSCAPPSSTDLSQILLNIKSCRWRHFRPRTLPLQELDNAHPLFRKLSRSLKRPLSATQAGGQPLRPARVVPPHAPTAGKCVEKLLV